MTVETTAISSYSYSGGRSMKKNQERSSAWQSYMGRFLAKVKMEFDSNKDSQHLLLSYVFRRSGNTNLFLDFGESLIHWYFGRYSSLVLNLQMKNSHSLWKLKKNSYWLEYQNVFNRSLWHSDLNWFWEYLRVWRNVAL